MQSVVNYICFFFQKLYFSKLTMGGGQNFERRNVERLRFQNVNTANIKITKVIRSFYYRIYFLIFSILLECSKYLITFQIVKY